MTAPKVTQRSIVSLKLPRAVDPLITHAQRIVASVTDNPHLPAPIPAPWILSKAVADLQTAQTATLARTMGTVEARDEKRWVLMSLLEQLRGCVQVAADADPENADAIIASTGLSVRKRAARAPRVFSATPGTASGEVKVIGPAAERDASYEWLYSVDGGRSWLDTPPTLQASTRIVGLTPGTSVMFSYRATTRRGTGAWSQPVTLPVVK